MRALAKFADRYRGVPKGIAFVVSAFISFMLAAGLGILAGIAASYLYDRGMSRGDDFAVFLGGFYAGGTFAFVVGFTWLQKLHHVVSSSTSLFAFYACLILPALLTVISADEMDYYSMFIVGDWLAILVIGLSGVLICRRWWEKSD